MTERQLQAAVLQLCKLLKLRVFHPWTSIHSAAGFPDLVLVGPHRVAFVELKSDKGKVSAAQQGWLDALSRAGCDAWVWRPCDWKSGAVEGYLRGMVRLGISEL